MSRLVPDPREPEALVCFDRCTEWTTKGSTERSDCLLGCPAILSLAGTCGQEPRCVELVREKVEFDGAATGEAIRVGFEVLKLVAGAMEKKDKLAQPQANSRPQSPSRQPATQQPRTLAKPKPK